jgi:hypothetical protein
MWPYYAVHTTQPVTKSAMLEFNGELKTGLCKEGIITTLTWMSVRRGDKI